MKIFQSSIPSNPTKRVIRKVVAMETPNPFDKLSAESGEHRMAQRHSDEYHDFDDNDKGDWQLT